MGLTFLELEVGNPATPEVTEKIKFLVDSGAIDSVAPTSVLDRLGIKPIAEQEFSSPMGQRSYGKRASLFLSAASGSAARM
jgi:hypothetical protein